MYLRNGMTHLRRAVAEGAPVKGNFVWLLLHAIAERVRHARATTLKIASTHARAVPAAKALRAVALFLRGSAKKCGAVDQPATLEGNPRQILSRLPQQQSSAPPAATRAMLTHNL